MFCLNHGSPWRRHWRLDPDSNGNISNARAFWKCKIRQGERSTNRILYIYIITLYQSLNLVFQNNGHRWLTVGPKIWTWSDSTVDKQILKQKAWNCVAGRQSAGLGGNFFQSRLWNLATLVFQELIDAPWQLSVWGILDRWSICIQDKTFAKGFALSLTCWCIQLTLAAGEPLAASMA